jgi:hypothetical protein
MDFLSIKSWSFICLFLICIAIFPLGHKAEAASPVCMIKKTKGQPRGNHDYTLVVPQSSVEAMTERGFKQRGCGRRIETAPKVARQMCALAAKNLPGVDASFAQEYGVTPAEICAMAQQASAS